MAKPHTIRKREEERPNNSSGKKHKVVSERHRRLLKRISDNLGSGMSIGEAMRLEGYSQSYSKTPSQLLSTRSWQGLAQEHLPDDLLTKVHRELLISDQWRARDAGLDKAYKIKGRYKEEFVVKKENDYSHLSDEELANKVMELVVETLDEAGLVAIEKTELEKLQKGNR